MMFTVKGHFKLILVLTWRLFNFSLFFFFPLILGSFWHGKAAWKRWAHRARCHEAVGAATCVISAPEFDVPGDERRWRRGEKWGESNGLSCQETDGGGLWHVLAVDNGNWNVINRVTPTISDVSASGTSSSTGSSGAKSAGAAAGDVTMSNGKYLSIRSNKSPAGASFFPWGFFPSQFFLSSPYILWPFPHIKSQHENSSRNHVTIQLNEIWSKTIKTPTRNQTIKLTPLTVGDHGGIVMTEWKWKTGIMHRNRRNLSTCHHRHDTFRKIDVPHTLSLQIGNLSYFSVSAGFPLGCELFDCQPKTEFTVEI